jgi:Helix-turn-helix of DDE superfamily endonuclease
MLRYQTIKDTAYRVLDLTSLTVCEFEQLAEPFETAFVRHMQNWTMEGKPRTGRAYSQYANCPLPTPQDRLLFILSYLKVANLQVAHGALFDMSQSNANKWLHVLLPVLDQTLLDLGDAPARHLAALARRLAELPQAEQDADLADSAAAPPLFIMMGVNDRSCVPRTLMSKKRIIAVRKSAIQ